LDQGPERARVHAKAGEAYAAAWRGCSLEVQGEDLGCAGAAQVVPRMIESFGESQHPDRHIYALLIARDRRWRAGSPDDAALISAAEKAEKSATNHPDAPASLEAIRMATYARIALGQAPVATKLLGTYRKQAAKTDQENVFALHIGLGTALNDAEKHADAQRALGTEPSKAPDRISILWLSESGRAAAGMNRPQPASQSFQKALQTWQGLPEGELRQHLGKAEPWPIPDRERVVEAVGAAHFFFAEQARLKGDKMPIPKYAGPDSVQGATDYINNTIGPYVRDRQARLIEADNAYRKISEIKPVPPSRWVVAAASRVGQMWAAFADDVINSPLPRHIAKDGELEAGYRKTLSESMKPVVEKSRRAFQICRDAAEGARVDDSHSKACTTWLAENAEP
jgi:hypothetical protein